MLTDYRRTQLTQTRLTQTLSWFEYKPNSLKSFLSHLHLAQTIFRFPWEFKLVGLYCPYWFRRCLIPRGGGGGGGT